MHIVLGVIAFTFFILCIVFWGGAIVAIVALLFRLAVFLAVIAAEIGALVMGTVVWLCMFPFAPGKAMAALRGTEHAPEIRRDTSCDPPGLPHPVKIYRAKPSGLPPAQPSGYSRPPAAVSPAWGAGGRSARPATFVQAHSPGPRRP